MGLIDPVSSDYRFSRAISVRLMGLSLAAIGVLVFLTAAVVGLLTLPIVVLTGAVGLALAGVLVVVVLLRRTVVVRLDEVGYQVRLVRGAGVRRARWKDVEDVVTGAVGEHPVVVLRLKDGRTTTVPVGVLAGSREDFVRDLQEHCSRGHGYRRLR